MKQFAAKLPARCFVSHAYADSQARNALIERLPAEVTPIVFPPITVKPDEFVSDPLIDAVLGCDGLIYLRGGASDRSFRVALERDYAIRAGKQVFAFDPATGELTPDPGPALDLAAFASYHHADASRVQRIADHLNNEGISICGLMPRGWPPEATWLRRFRHRSPIAWHVAAMPSSSGPMPPADRTSSRPSSNAPQAACPGSMTACCSDCSSRASFRRSGRLR